MSLVVLPLNLSTAIRLLDGLPHRIRHPVCVHDHVAIRMSRGSPDRLDEGALREKVSLLIGVENRNQAHFGKVETFSKQVDTNHDVVHAETQVPKHINSLHNVHVAVKVVNLDAKL